MFIYKKLSKSLISLFTLFIIMSSQFTFAETTKSNEHISFNAPWVRAMPPMVMHTAGYVEIHNASTVADKLIRVWSPAINTIEVHQTKQVDGVFKMLEAKNTRIPPNGKLILQPGGYHLMMMGIKSPLIENETLVINFEFERAGVVQMNFPIRKK
ncbi:copper chaperone PCu(A)C [Pseudocolwellia sp. AS88]|uniref:copper chaperone PCu(A)C n=1 Tax=Pseudocolwellia sp. AS88 TaxID=3063958 RepID=UPI0026EF95F5|nr:copper chaperone PCu(A)C [Pseudocolwellia sp. AS88]MDO7084172.1 copper chaperone PCu(A)C [Pseudocolwellia sp. AS88]